MSEYPNNNVVYHKRRCHRKRHCAVCSALACGRNFNAFTCDSCRAFFRRYAVKQFQSLRCSENGSCIVDVSTRRLCTFCRLKKCLAVGMDRQMVKIVEAPVRKKSNCSGQFQTENSNRLCILENNSPLSLITDADHLLINQIRHAYKNRTQYFRPVDILPELFSCDHSVLHCSTLSQLINARSITILRLIYFFKFSSSQFQQLNTDDQVALIKFNVPSLFWLDMSLCYNPTTNSFREDERYDLIFNGENLLDFYGIDIYNRIIKYILLLHDFSQMDPIIIYLLILILFFSHFSSCTSLDEPVLHDYNHIRQTQDLYTTLLVQILMDKFGEKHAYFLISKLILICLNIQNLSRDICFIDSRQISDENISSLMKVFLIR